MPTYTPNTAEKNLPHHHMIYVEGGTFMMGSKNGDEDEKPVHKVTLDAFYIAKYPVTQALWKAIMGDKNPSAFEGDDRPVEKVNWHDAQQFIQKLNAATDQKYRLPTEAEWEYAARGGKYSEGYQYAGSDAIEEVAWYGHSTKDNLHRETKPVGLKYPNELGIYDMSGNVWEWCEDWKGNYLSDAQVNPTGPTEGTDRVFRGGSWGSVPRYCRVAYRGLDSPFSRLNVLGFRLARTL